MSCGGYLLVLKRPPVLASLLINFSEVFGSRLFRILWIKGLPKAGYPIIQESPYDRTHIQKIISNVAQESQYPQQSPFAEFRHLFHSDEK